MMCLPHLTDPDGLSPQAPVLGGGQSSSFFSSTPLLSDAEINALRRSSQESLNQPLPLPDSVLGATISGLHSGLRAGELSLVNSFSFGQVAGGASQQAFRDAGLEGTLTQQITVGSGVVAREAALGATGITAARAAAQGVRGARVVAQGVGAVDIATGAVSTGEGIQSIAEGQYVQGSLEIAGGAIGVGGGTRTLQVAGRGVAPVRGAVGEAHNAANAIKLNKALASQEQVGQAGARIAGHGRVQPAVCDFHTAVW